MTIKTTGWAYQGGLLLFCVGCLIGLEWSNLTVAQTRLPVLVVGKSSGGYFARNKAHVVRYSLQVKKAGRYEFGVWVHRQRRGTYRCELWLKGKRIFGRAFRHGTKCRFKRKLLGKQRYVLRLTVPKSKSLRRYDIDVRKERRLAGMLGVIDRKKMSFGWGNKIWKKSKVTNRVGKLMGLSGFKVRSRYRPPFLSSGGGAGGPLPQRVRLGHRHKRFFHRTSWKKTLKLRFNWPVRTTAEVYYYEAKPRRRFYEQLSYRMTLSRQGRSLKLAFHSLKRSSLTVQQDSHALNSRLLPTLYLNRSGALLKVGSRYDGFAHVLRWFPKKRARSLRRSLQSRIVDQLLGSDFYQKIIGSYRHRTFRRGVTQSIGRKQKLKWVDMVRCYRRKRAKRCARFHLLGPNRRYKQGATTQRIIIVLEKDTMLPHQIELQRTEKVWAKRGFLARYRGTTKLMRRHTFYY